MSVYTKVNSAAVTTEIAMPELRWIIRCENGRSLQVLQQRWEIETITFAEPRNIRGVAFEWRDIPVVPE